MYLIEIKDKTVTQLTFTNDNNEKVPYYRQSAIAHTHEGQVHFDFGVGANNCWETGFYIIGLDTLKLTNQGGGFVGATNVAKPGSRLNLQPVDGPTLTAIQSLLKQPKAA